MAEYLFEDVEWYDYKERREISWDRKFKIRLTGGGGEFHAEIYPGAAVLAMYLHLGKKPTDEVVRATRDVDVRKIMDLDTLVVTSKTSFRHATPLTEIEKRRMEIRMAIHRKYLDWGVRLEEVYASQFDWTDQEVLGDDGKLETTVD